MRELFGTSSVVEEARLSARKNAKEGKKPESVLGIVLKSFSLMIVSHIVMSILMAIYLFVTMFDVSDSSMSIPLNIYDPKLMLIMLYSELLMIIT